MKFEITVSTNRVGSTCSKIIERDDEDLEGIEDSEIDNYVWDELGGLEAAVDMCNMSIKRIG